MIIHSLKKQKKNPKNYFYVSNEWRLTRERFMISVPWVTLQPIRGIRYSNKYCCDCWEKGIINDKRIEVDHVKPIKEGGDKHDFTNLKSRCHAHHNKKTSIDNGKFK